MKRTDLEKLKGLKIQSKLKGGATPDRYGKASGQRPEASPAADSLIARLLQRRTDAKE